MIGRRRFWRIIIIGILLVVVILVIVIVIVTFDFILINYVSILRSTFICRRFGAFIVVQYSRKLQAKELSQVSLYRATIVNIIN